MKRNRLKSERKKIGINTMIKQVIVNSNLNPALRNKLSKQLGKELTSLMNVYRPENDLTNQEN